MYGSMDKGDFMEIVVNKCYGGFSLSPEATLWCYEHGMKELATPVDEYFRFAEQAKISSYIQWTNYQSDPTKGSLFVTVFSADGKFVLNTRPSDRSNPILVNCVKTLGEKANGSCAKLRIVEIPDDVEYEIQEYDGQEWIAEKHRTWY